MTVVWLLFSSGMPLRLLSRQSFWIAGPYLGVVIGGLLLGLGNNLGRAVKRPLWAIPLAFFGGVLAGSAALFLLLLLGGQHTHPSIALAVLCAPALAALT
ncbi:MAG: hypothetical protein J7521_23170, partial [Caulobacter sp.]|nr:hypothetical protein [Caulobacter sp.]